MTVDRKELTRAYKQTPRAMGVFRVTNSISGVSLIGASRNLPAILNRHRAELQGRGYRDQEFQRLWNEHGPDVFTFEVLDTLTPSDAPGYDPGDDLGELERMWIEKLAPLSKRAL